MSKRIRLTLAIFASLFVAAALSIPALSAHAAGGATFCASNGSTWACTNAWNGGPFVKVYTDPKTNNNQFDLINPSGHSNGYALEFVGGGSWDGKCIGDAYNDPNNDTTSLDTCPTASSGGGYGTSMTIGTSGCPYSSLYGQSEWFHDNHWNSYLTVSGFSNGDTFYLLGSGNCYYGLSTS